MNFKKLTALSITLCLCLALAACGAPKSADDWQAVQDKGELVIGYTLYEPMNYTDDAGNLVGFETEFAEAVCEKLGVKAKFQLIIWDSKVIELDAKSIDCIWNGMTINEDLKKNLSISQPYIRNKQVVVVKAENLALYPDTKSLAAATIMAEAGSAGESVIAGDEFLSQATYLGASKQTDGLLEVKAGTQDAAVLDSVMAKASTGEGTDFADLAVIPAIELGIEEFGVGFRKDSTLTAKVDEAITTLMTDGTLKTLAEKYGLGESLLTPEA